MKTVDLSVRPVFHHSEQRVRAHVFLCMLAYYVEWHIRERLKPMLFDDEHLDEASASRASPVAKDIRSEPHQPAHAGARVTERSARRRERAALGRHVPRTQRQNSSTSRAASAGSPAAAVPSPPSTSSAPPGNWLTVCPERGAAPGASVVHAFAPGSKTPATE